MLELIKCCGVYSYRCSEALADDSVSKKRLKVSNIKGINKKRNQLPEPESDSEEESSSSDFSETDQETSVSIPAEVVEEASVEEVVANKEEAVKKVEVPKKEEKAEKKREVERIPAIFVPLNRKPEIQVSCYILITAVNI